MPPTLPATCMMQTWEAVSRMMHCFKGPHSGCKISKITPDKFYELWLVAAGLIGSLIFLGNSDEKSFRRGIIAIATGVAVSYFLTPVFVHMPVLADWSVNSSHKTDYAMAFFLGATGWRTIVWAQNKFFKKPEDGNDQ